MAKRELPMEPEPTAPCVTHPHCGLTEAEVEAAAREMARLVGEDPDSTRIASSSMVTPSR